MICRESSLDEITDVIKKCLIELYSADAFLFGKNDGRAIHENCLVFRFAHYLQNELDGLFYVDHDFNSSFEYITDENGNYEFRERSAKKFVDSQGQERDCLVDIIVHERNYDGENDFICFEFKKWNSTDADSFKKDEAKLKYLTSTYGYKYGFHIIFGNQEDNTRWKVYSNGAVLEDTPPLYE